jgi:cob(I)alamin adenosyltransferase
VKIYTKTGDSGETALFGGGRVPKSDPRVAAYGEIDELNAWVGAVRARVADPEVQGALERVQQDLFVLGAILATPNPARRKGEKFTLDDGRIAALEREIDAWEAGLPPLTTFILPGGSSAGSLLHAARAVCRRAERGIVALEAEDLPATVLPYVNRLSDWLFVCARHVNRLDGAAEIPW